VPQPVYSNDMRIDSSRLAPEPQFGPGTYRIGTAPGDMPPGVYRTEGAAVAGGPWCTWDKGTNIAARASAPRSAAPAEITLLPEDVAFYTEFCAPWRRIG
jgi:hypothetical protein